MNPRLKTVACQTPPKTLRGAEDEHELRGNRSGADIATQGGHKFTGVAIDIGEHVSNWNGKFDHQVFTHEMLHILLGHTSSPKGWFPWARQHRENVQVDGVLRKLNQNQLNGLDSLRKGVGNILQ